ncbi:SphA family protein [Nevskia ramosa]|uniref:SphA family protein n=1 Tax=Nevskia ramosa TaxID=64002 RepID=UPI002353C7EF|nr:transporter [Nevskia ramosa]
MTVNLWALARRAVTEHARMTCRLGVDKLRAHSLNAALLLVLGSLVVVPGHAAENGLSNFSYGTQTTYAAWMPPPGASTFLGYALYLKADSIRDAKGDRIPGVEAEFAAVAPRALHTWKRDFYGWKMTSGGVVQMVNAEVTAPGVKDHDFSITLVGIEPLYLSKTFGTMTYFTGPFLFFPTGGYRRNSLAHSATNYFSATWQASASWNPDPRTDVSVNVAYEWKDKNSATDYRSGDQSSITFGAGYKPFDDMRWDFGINGYYIDQFSDDRLNGASVPGGGRTKAFALGPKFVFWPGAGKAIVVQYQKGLMAENGAKADLLWFELAYPF